MVIKDKSEVSEYLWSHIPQWNRSSKVRRCPAEVQSKTQIAQITGAKRTLEQGHDKHEEPDEVLAFLYLELTHPILEDYKRIPLLIRQSWVIETLEWLKLSHCNYLNIKILQENMNRYPEDRPLVNVNYYEVDAIKDAEAIAVNNNNEKDGISKGECPFTVHTLISDQFIDFLNKDEREIIKNKALQHVKHNDKALAITHKKNAESLYNNPQLYLQIFS